MKKKILFIGPWPPPFGGISSHLYELLPGLYDKNNDIYLFSFSKSWVIKKTIINGIEMHSISIYLYFLKNIFSILFSLLINLKQKKDLNFKKYISSNILSNYINNFISSTGINFIFTYDNYLLTINPFIRQNKFKHPHIFNTIYGDFILNPKMYNTQMQFYKYAISKSSKILSCSKYCVDSGKSFFNIEYKTNVFYNNVSEIIYNPNNSGLKIRERHHVPKNAILLMTMGRVGYDMGVDFLLDNLDTIFSIDDKLYILIVGARAELSNRVQFLSLSYPRLKYSFDITFEDKPLYYAACDIFTSPTKEKHACMGISNIEAMMSNKPIISSNSGGHKETIEDSVSGILVPFINGKINTEIYINQLKNLIYNPEHRIKLGNNGRSRALNLFTNKKIVNDHLNFLNNY
jgi:glycosyltransferase involved in cell wall biosynthesis